MGAVNFTSSMPKIHGDSAGPASAHWSGFADESEQVEIFVSEDSGRLRNCCQWPVSRERGGYKRGPELAVKDLGMGLPPQVESGGFHVLRARAYIVYIATMGFLLTCLAGEDWLSKSQSETLTAFIDDALVDISRA